MDEIAKVQPQGVAYLWLDFFQELTGVAYEGVA